MGLKQKLSSANFVMHLQSTVTGIRVKDTWLDKLHVLPLKLYPAESIDFTVMISPIIA